MDIYIFLQILHQWNNSLLYSRNGNIILNFMRIFMYIAQYYLLIYCTICSNPGIIYTPLSIRYWKICGKCKFTNIERTNIYLTREDVCVCTYISVRLSVARINGIHANGVAWQTSEYICIVCIQIIGVGNGRVRCFVRGVLVFLKTDNCHSVCRNTEITIAII